MDILRYTVKDRELKPRGYTFQKLYAMNYKTYRKKIEGYTMWLWSKGRLLEINDWHGYTGILVDYYCSNIEKHKKNAETNFQKEYMVIYLDRKNHKLQEIDKREYVKALMEENEEFLEWRSKFQEIVFHISSFDEVIKEIDHLTK